MGTAAHSYRKIAGRLHARLGNWVYTAHTVTFYVSTSIYYVCACYRRAKLAFPVVYMRDFLYWNVFACV